MGGSKRILIIFGAFGAVACLQGLLPHGVVCECECGVDIAQMFAYKWGSYTYDLLIGGD